MNIGIYIYDDAEVLDFSGPFEVFSTAARVGGLSSEALSVFLISESGGTVRARAGYQVTANYGFENHPSIDLLMVVGGVHTGELKKPAVLSWVATQAEKARWLSSVCTGVFILAEAGVLEEERVTTHWEDIPDLKARYPRLQVVEGKRWVEEGRLITSGGISAGIDMSLYWVSRLFDLDLAQRTARQMEFDWTVQP